MLKLENYLKYYYLFKFISIIRESNFILIFFIFKVIIFFIAILIIL